MKKIFIPYLAFIICPMYLIGQSQFIDINYTAQQKTVADIFEDLTNTYGISFSYATSSIEDQLKDLDISDGDIETLLDELLRDLDLEYKIVDNHVLIRKSKDFASKEGSPTYQKSLHLRGLVQHSDEDLSFATVRVSNSHIGTFTDELGGFDIEIPAEYHDEDIIIEYLGFEDVSYTLRDIGKEILLVQMQPSAIAVQEVMIVNQEKPIRIATVDNGLTLNKRQLENPTSGLAGSDIARQIQTIAGVSATDDTSTEIKIRGSNADETLMILDGMPIYKADHYYGMFSAFNPGYIDQVTLYKNHFPIVYGGKTAGIVSVKSTSQIATKPRVEVDLNLMNTSINTLLPITTKWQLHLSGRTTLRNVSNTQFNTFAPTSQTMFTVAELGANTNNLSANPAFSFYDVNAKSIFQINPSSSIQLNFFRSYDDVNTTLDRVISGRNRDLATINSSEDQIWQNTAANILHTTKWKNETQWTTDLYSSSFEDATDFSFSNQLNTRNRSDTITLQNNNNTSIQDYGLKSFVSTPLGGGTFSGGLTAIYHDISYGIDDNGTTLLSGDTQVWENSLSAGWQAQISNGLSIDIGLRGTHYSQTDQVYLSPRLLAQYALSEALTLKTSYSINQQFIKEFEYEYRGQTRDIWIHTGTNNVPVLSSQNIMIGGTYRHDLFALDIELYQKNMNGVTEYAVVQPRNNQDTRDYQLFDGEGRYRGIDIMISSGHEHWDTYVAYSLSSFEQRYDEIVRNSYFPTEDDRRHQLKWINTYTLGDWSLGADLIYSSGRPYTDISMLASGRDIRDTRRAERFRYLPAYTRLDISVGHKISLGAQTLRLSAGLFNVFNQANVSYIQSVAQTIPQQSSTPINAIFGSESTLLGRTLNLSAKLSF